jgi:hypothetical protein
MARFYASHCSPDVQESSAFPNFDLNHHFCTSFHLLHFLLQYPLLLSDEFQLVNPTVRVFDLLVGALEVESELIFAFSVLGLILLECRLYLLVGILPAFCDRYIWCLSRALACR